MSCIVTSILSSTVGLLWNNARDSTAAKLKDGDVTDAKIREIVVRELSDIKTKLDGLSRVDLLSSSIFLTEGVDLLCVSLDNSKLGQKAVMEPTQQDLHGEASRMLSDVESGILSEALELSDAMGKMKIHSDKEFQSAKKSFEYAHRKATEAFYNQALNITDVIYAVKLLVVSVILECLDSPLVAITESLSFLQDLHRIPALCGIFSAYLSRTKSLFGSNENRVEIVKSVMMINYVLYQFNLKFSRRKLTDMFIWPATIQLDNGRSFNPILDWREVATRNSMGDVISQLRDPYKLLLDEIAIPVLSAVNNRKLVVEKKVDEIGKNK